MEDVPTCLGNAEQIELHQLLTSRKHRKHFEMNRHMYRNPDLPVGFEKTPASITYKDAIKMDGQYFYYLNLAYESVSAKDNNVFLDLEGMSDLELSCPEEEGEEEEEPAPVEITIKKELTEEEEDKKRRSHKKQKDEDTVSRKIKKERKDEHKKKSSKPKSEHSNDSDHSSHKESRSSSPLSAQVKQEAEEPPEHLYGHYHCDVCNITMNSLLTFNTHVNGKKHLKNLKLKNIPEAVAKTIPGCAVELQRGL